VSTRSGLSPSHRNQAQRQSSSQDERDDHREPNPRIRNRDGNHRRNHAKAAQTFDLDTGHVDQRR
jgi:hypothetical protein